LLLPKNRTWPTPYLKCSVHRTATRCQAATALSPGFGFRPLKRFLQRELETRIGRALVAGSIPDGGTLTIALEKGSLAIRRKNPAVEPAK